MSRTVRLLLIVLVTAFIVAAGCAPKEEVKQTAAEPTPAPTQVEKATYTVQKGDTLWKISGTDAYGDAFEWPILFRANRDQIQDPDIIEVNQQLEINKDVTAEDKEKAIQNAKDTPPYKKHDKPRTKLPLQY